jgi:TolB-like protein/tetratricopeptide (TPR) repeat protein
MVGETLSRYRLVAHLGSGAMGDVYRAEDERLRRTVALKVVRAACDPEETSRRLLAEARAGSAFTHPNIAVVYEVDEVRHDGETVSFIAMEYVDGRTLADLAADGLLSLDTILDIGRQVADALAAAHAYGLLHRDIKPSNVMVTEHGLVKVLDFGVARWSAPIDDASTTRTVDPIEAAAAGTLSYMSPEQITGRAVDGRSDMFSLGVVLYELIAGHRLFESANAARVIEAVLQKEAPALQRHLDDPRLPAVQRIVRRMLEKDPVNRFEDLRAVGLALGAVQRGEPLAGLRSEAAFPIVAVTEFRNISANAEDDWLGTGIAETLTADLEGFEGITMVPRGRVSELARTLERQSGEANEALWIRVGRELGARWVLTGSFQRAGDAVRVTAHLLDAATALTERTIKVDGRMQEIFVVQDRLVREVADLVRAVIRPTNHATLETGVVGAYEAFSRGVLNLRAETYESLDRAVMLFEHAVDLDPAYARAHLELGVAYATKADYLAQGELRARAVKSLRRAIELQPDAVRAWRELGSVLIAMGQDDHGFEALRRALVIEPADAGALGAMARALFVGRAQFDEAASWYERALAANPKAGWYALQLTHCAALLRDFVRGEAAAARAIELQQAALSGQEGVLIVGASMRLGHLRALQGRSAEAIAAYMQELAFLSDIDHALRNRVIVELNVRLGAAHLSLGEARKGHALLEAAIDAFDRRVRLGSDEPFTRYYAAAAHALIGDADTAIAFLERAAAVRRAFTLERARIEPEFAALRQDVRLQRMLSDARQNQ